MQLSPVSVQFNSHLVCVHKDDLVHSQREQHIQEEDLVSPDYALLLSLLVEPTRPLILDQFILKAIRLSHVRDGLLNTQENKHHKKILINWKLINTFKFYKNILCMYHFLENCEHIIQNKQEMLVRKHEAPWKRERDNSWGTRIWQVFQYAEGQTTSLFWNRQEKNSGLASELQEKQH